MSQCKDNSNFQDETVIAEHFKILDESSVLKLVE